MNENVGHPISECYLSWCGWPNEEPERPGWHLFDPAEPKAAWEQRRDQEDARIDAICDRVEALVEHINQVVVAEIKQAIATGILRSIEDFEFFLEDFEDLDYSEITPDLFTKEH